MAYLNVGGRGCVPVFPYPTVGGVVPVFLYLTVGGRGCIPVFPYLGVVG